MHASSSVTSTHQRKSDRALEVVVSYLWPSRKASGSSVTRCKFRLTKQSEIRFHAVLGDGAREVRFEWGTG
jgi:hypothetical protein